MFSRVNILLMFFLSLAALDVYSQETEEYAEEVYNEDVSLFEFSVDRLFLLNTFKSTVGKNLYGLSCSILNQRDAEGYTFFGVNLNYAHIGSFSADVVEGGISSFNDNTSSNFVSALFVYRHYLPFYYKAIEPYFEVGLGPHFFFTTTSTTFFSDNTTDLIFEESDFGLTYGINAGVTIKIVNQFFALIRIGYYGGIATTYLAPEETLTTNYPVDSFDQRTSQTNFLKLQLGIAYSF